MRTTIIPAQITTVEDKIAGSLNMMQILILMFPILWTAIIYVLCPPGMKLSTYKVGLILVCVLVCIVLVLRIKEKIVAEWLGVFFRYHFRPRYWIYNKNDTTSRVIDIPNIPDIALLPKKSVNKAKHQVKADISIADLVKLEGLLESGKVAVHYRFEK